MIDVCLLGTGGMMPLPYRALTSLMLRYNGTNVLVDCGEGVQISIKKQGWSFKQIDVICITHFHADHVSGLPGLLLTIGNAERKEPITIIGPKNVEKVVNCLRIIAPELPFEINFIEIKEDGQVMRIEDLHINTYKVNHNMLCYGYSFYLDRAGRFDVNLAKNNEVPMMYWSRLQKGETIEGDGITYSPDMVLGADRKGLKITYATDSRPTDSILENARNADLFICEGMYGEDGKEAKAREYKHMTMYEAAQIASDANVKELWLTHYSPSLVNPEQYQDKVRSIFENSFIPKEKRSVTLVFDEE